MAPRLLSKVAALLVSAILLAGLSAPASAQGMFDLEGAFDSGFIRAIRDGDNETVERELLQASPNERSNRGVPAIIIAVEAENDEALEMLIAAGARVDNRDRDDRTALGVAAHAGEIGIVRTLLAAGADPERQGQHRETPLLKASRQGEIEIVRALIEAGAEADTSDLTGRTALEYAEQYRYRDVAELLREHGAY